MRRFLKSFLTLLSRPVVSKMYSPLLRLKANREVETIDTLIIGDLISDSQLRRYCSLERSMKVLSPGRSVYASSCILSHLSSVLASNGTVIIVDGGSNSGLTEYDYPYLYWVYAMENGVPDNPTKRNIPILYMPLKSLQMLMGISFHHYRISECSNDVIKELCSRKGFKLVNLS